MATDQAHELLRIHFMAVTAGILMSHRRATNIVGLSANLLCPAFI